MASRKKAAKAETKPGSSEAGELLGAVYEGGVHYSRKNPAKFAEAVKSGKVSAEAVQRAANAGALKGFGSSASEAKKAQKAAEADAEGTEDSE